MGLSIQPLAPLDVAAVLPDALICQQLALEADDPKMALARVHAAAALGRVERHTALSLTKRNWRVTLDGFAPATTIPIGPVTEIVFLSYLDASGSVVDGAGLWRLGGGSLYPAPGTSWPVTLDQAGAVVVEVVAGFADVGADAPALRAAALIVLMHLWAGGAADDLPATAEAMLCDLRLPVIA